MFLWHFSHFLLALLMPCYRMSMSLHHLLVCTCFICNTGLFMHDTGVLRLCFTCIVLPCCLYCCMLHFKRSSAEIEIQLSRPLTRLDLIYSYSLATPRGWQVALFFLSFLNYILRFAFVLPSRFGGWRVHSQSGTKALSHPAADNVWQRPKRRKWLMKCFVFSEAFTVEIETYLPHSIAGNSDPGLSICWEHPGKLPAIVLLRSKLRANFVLEPNLVLLLFLFLFNHFLFFVFCF